MIVYRRSQKSPCGYLAGAGGVGVALGLRNLGPSVQGRVGGLKLELGLRSRARESEVWSPGSRA
eukprot:1904877-Rhodomonas_salina.3